MLNEDWTPSYLVTAQSVLEVDYSDRINEVSNIYNMKKIGKNYLMHL